MIQFRRALIAVFAASLLSSTVYADSFVIVRGVRVNGSAMSGLGVTLTWIDKNYTHTQYLNYVGWGLVIGGIAIGSGSTTGSMAQELSASSVWNSLRSESRLAANHSALIDETSAIFAAANKSKISVTTLAALTGEVDRVTAAARKLGQTISVEDVVAKVGANSSMHSVVANMAQIALIAQ